MLASNRIGVFEMRLPMDLLCHLNCGTCGSMISASTSGLDYGCRRLFLSAATLNSGFLDFLVSYCSWLLGSLRSVHVDDFGGPSTCFYFQVVTEHFQHLVGSTEKVTTKLLSHSRRWLEYSDLVSNFKNRRSCFLFAFVVPSLSRPAVYALRISFAL